MRTAYLGRGGHRLLARNPPKRGHGSDAGPLGRERAAATRTRIRTAAPSAHQTHRGCCRYALRRGGTASFARAVR